MFAVSLVLYSTIRVFRMFLRAFYSCSSRFPSSRLFSSQSNNLLHRAQLKCASPQKTLFKLGTDREISYGQFLVSTGRCATILSERYGIMKGERVLARVSKTIDSVVLYAACLQLGAVYIPVNPIYTNRETAHFVKDAEPKLFITCQHSTDQIFAKEINNVVDERLFSHETSSAKSSTDIEYVEKNDTACICYTSGTTGLPKGAMLTHGSLSSNAESLVELWRFTDSDRLLHMLPFYHVHGMFISLNCSLFSHSTVIWREKFDVDDCINWMKDSTVMMGIPTFYSRLLSNDQFGRDCVQSIRLFVSGSAPLSLATWERFEQRTGHRILERYGMTEAQVICSNLYDISGRVPGSVGKPIKGTQLRLNVNGGIEIKSDSLFGGYWRNPAKTAEDFTDDNYFVTGDVAEIDDEGFVRIMGRSKDLVISGGMNVYPKEIEDIIDRIVGIKESAIIGVPHEDFGEAVVAVVALRKDMKEATATDTIVARLKEQLASYKVPKQIVFIEDLPRNSMAKVQKNILRQTFSKLYN